jgi:hypothetical protein
VVTCVTSARFFTRPHASPCTSANCMYVAWRLLNPRTSGVSDGHNMPHWLGCRARGPDTLRVFSNCT